MITSRGELKLSQNTQNLLGVSHSQVCSMQLTYHPINLQYLEYLLDHYRDDHVSLEEVEEHTILLKYLRFQLNTGVNILHLMQSNLVFL